MNAEAERVLSVRELNRATLARQMLLERSAVPPYDAIERLAGLQGQHPNSPYIGLWTRLQGFIRDDLAHLIEDRRVVRATLMRSTLHLVTDAEYLLFRPAVQPALERAFRGFFKDASRRIHLDRLAEATAAFAADEPRTFPELRAFLSHLEPDEDPAALSYAARALVPLVQVPPAGFWGAFGSPAYVSAEHWIGQPLNSPEEGLRHLVLRYLAAWGPATRKDVEAWSGLSRLQSAIEGLMPHLVTYQDQEGRTLYDLPSAPLPGTDVPAPPRFLPEYDNLVLSHADRTRILPEEYRKRVILPPSRVLATFIIDGMVEGTWRVERSREQARLLVEPFEPLAADDVAALITEGERLIRFIEEDATSYSVRLVT